MERLTNTREERVNLIKPFIEPAEQEFSNGLKVPTKAHKCIAELVKKGYIKVIVTTNFDRLIENALKEIGVEPSVISNPVHIENVMPLVHSPFTLIKINGDYLETKFLNIKSELEDYEKDLKQLLVYVFENYGLITCGWSGKWDLALVEILKSSNKFRYSNYFTYMLNPEESLEAISILRRGRLVQIKDADLFFKEVAEAVEAMENNQANHPLSAGVVLGRLKKYLPREEHIISLHDLFYNVIEDAHEKSNTFDYSKAPTPELIKDCLERHFDILDLVCVLMANTGYWGKDIHFDIVIKGLKRLLDLGFVKNTSGNAVWGSVKFSPAMVSRYVCGIGALASMSLT